MLTAIRRLFGHLPAPPPFVEPRVQPSLGTADELLHAALQQLARTLAAVPDTEGPVDSRVETRQSYGHTHLHLTCSRLKDVSTGRAAREAAGRRAIRETLKTYVEKALPGSGWTRHFACGDSELTIEARWMV